VRIASAPTLLLFLAVGACTSPQQEGAYCPWARQALAAVGAAPPPAAPTAPATTAPAGPPIALTTPAPAPPPPAAVVAVAYQPSPLPWIWFHQRGPGRLILSNFTYGLADVEAVVTPYADCALHPGIVARDFKLPLNGTWVIDASVGSDICWRRLPNPTEPAEANGMAPPPAPPSAAEVMWNRAFTGAGQLIDAQL
jgi:hypothetical protein